MIGPAISHPIGGILVGARSKFRSWRGEFLGAPFIRWAKSRNLGSQQKQPALLTRCRYLLFARIPMTSPVNSNARPLPRAEQMTSGRGIRFQCCQFKNALRAMAIKLAFTKLNFDLESGGCQHAPPALTRDCRAFDKKRYYASVYMIESSAVSAFYWTSARGKTLRQQIGGGSLPVVHVISESLRSSGLPFCAAGFAEITKHVERAIKQHFSQLG